jgi:hypothetical protein
MGNNWFQSALLNFEHVRFAEIDAVVIGATAFGLNNRMPSDAGLVLSHG